jgi:hypothetical protein
MDRSTEWPWSSEEEARWKAELQEGELAFLEDVIDSTFEDGTTDSHNVLESLQEEAEEEDRTVEKYSITT